NAGTSTSPHEAIRHFCASDEATKTRHVARLDQPLAQACSAGIVRWRACAGHNHGDIAKPAQEPHRTRLYGILAPATKPRKPGTRRASITRGGRHAAQALCGGVRVPSKPP